MSNTDVYNIVTDKVIAALEGGSAPWRKPWIKTADGGLPLSMSTKKPYRGINVFLLWLEAMEHGYTSPWWGTYKQITELGGQVRKGEKSSLVVFWKILDKDVTDATGQTKVQKIYFLRYFNVFNSGQADGLPEKFYPAPEAQSADDLNRINGAQIVAETIFADYLARENIELRNTDKNQCFYQPGADFINLPPTTSFPVIEEYYSAAFHEAGHSTGHASRLNREGIITHTHFGSELYSKEELVAEMTSAFLCGVTGIETTIENSAAYLANWCSKLREDPKLIVQAAALAQKASDYVQGTVFGSEASSEPTEALEDLSMKSWTVVDTKDIQIGQQCPVLGRFSNEGEAATFISTLPEYETGRYGLDGPEDTFTRWEQAKVRVFELDLSTDSEEK